MNEQIRAFKTEFQRFLEHSVVLPKEISDAYEVCNGLSESKGKAIYIVTSKVDHQRYILKTADRHCKEDIEEEYSLLDTLDGGGFPRPVAFYKDDSHKYLIRQYIEGVTLEEYVDEHGPFSEAESIRIVCNVCVALERLHALQPPVIHRDIKPQNIIYTPDRSCVLIDLGAARRYRRNIEKDTVCIGSEITAAPEQFGYRQTDVRSDVYAVGILLLYLCTGSFDLERCNDIQNKRLNAVVRHCTRFDPANRYPSVHRVHVHLKRIPKATQHWYTSFPAGLALGLVLGATLGFFVMQSLPESQPTVSADDTMSIATTSIESSAQQPVTFQSELIASAVRQSLGVGEGTPIYESDLSQVTQLLILGDSVYSEWDEFLWNALYGAQGETGTINSIEDIQKLPNLMALGLAGQRISDISMLERTNITKLALCDNIISDLSPLAGMPCIAELYIGQNPISDITALSEVPTLTLLDVSDTSVTDLTPLTGSHLHSLNLFHAPIEDYSVLSGLQQLETLKVNHLNSDDIAECGRLGQLVTLFLCDTPALTNLAPLSGMTRLTFLDLSSNGITDVAGIESFTNLDYICLINNPVSDLSPLTKLSNISGLNITGLSLSDYTCILQISSLQRVYCNAEQESIIKQLPGGDALSFIVN